MSKSAVKPSPRTRYELCAQVGGEGAAYQVFASKKAAIAVGAR